MRCKSLVIITVIALLLILAGCSKAECKKDIDCTKAHFTGKCTDKKCAYTPIPNECGNSLCESKENKCTCPDDCGSCSGKLGKYLEQMCNDKQTECIQDIPASAQKPITLTKELSTGGTKFELTTYFNQPFNIKKDQFELEFSINSLASGMSDIKISRLELTGMTSDKRTIQLTDKVVNRNLFEGGRVKERLIIDFPTNDKDGEFTNLNLKVYLDYVQTSGTSSSQKSTTLTNSYSSLKFAWAKPNVTGGCPVCENMPGMSSDCGPQTSFFCTYTPIPGVCGSGVCDGSKNKCTCPADCGPCTGGGTYLSRACVSNNCVSQLKSGITVQPQSLFDARPMGPFELQNNYKYNSPFNVKTDKFTLEFKLQSKQSDVGTIKLTDVRLLDGSQEIASTTIGKELANKDDKQTADFTVTAAGAAEQERSLTLRVWYEYTQGNDTKQGDFSKALGKVVLLNPDV
jgi:hypothetical protein